MHRPIRFIPLSLVVSFVALHLSTAMESYQPNEFHVYDLPKDVPEAALLAALKSNDKEHRLLTALQIKKFPEGRQALIPALAGLLADHDEQIRIAAAGAIREVGLQKGHEDLVKNHLANESKYVRLLLSEACLRGSILQDSAHDIIMDLLHDPIRTWKMDAAIVSCAYMPKESIPVLVAALKETQGLSERFRTIVALGKAGKDASAALPMLRELSHDDSSQILRDAAKNAIDGIVSTDRPSVPQSPPVRPSP